MQKRVKIISILLLITVVTFISCYSVFAYEYQEPSNESDIISRRQNIYSWYDFYNSFKGNKGNTNLLTNYSGACSTVKVGNKTYPLEEYVAGVVKSEMGCASDSLDALKAQAIAARSFLIASKQNDATCSVESGQSFQVFSEVNSGSDQIYIQAAQDTAGMVVTHGGSVALTQYQSIPNQKWWTETPTSLSIQFQKFSSDSSSTWTWTGPSLSQIKQSVNCGISPVTGDTNHHYGMSQDIAEYLAKAENYTFEQIISLFYGEDISTIADGVYDDNVTYIDSGFGSITYYNQGDYASYFYSENPYSSNTYGGTIKSHGCGPTSLAIVISSLSGAPVSPIEVTQKTCQVGGCTTGGTYFNSLGTVARQYGYNVTESSNRQEVINALSSGNSLVIVLMGPGKFTTSGHYIVLTGVNSSGQVSVADPGSRNRTNQKWFAFNTILEQKKSNPFMIISR